MIATFSFNLYYKRDIHYHIESLFNCYKWTVQILIVSFEEESTQWSTYVSIMVINGFIKRKGHVTWKLTRHFFKSPLDGMGQQPTGAQLGTQTTHRRERWRNVAVRRKEDQEMAKPN